MYPNSAMDGRASEAYAAEKQQRHSISFLLHLVLSYTIRIYSHKQRNKALTLATKVVLSEHDPKHVSFFVCSGQACL